MEIILKENFPSLGYVGERVDVKRGYARNFLIPRGIAVEVTSRNAKVLKHRLDMIGRKKARLHRGAQEVADKMKGLILEFKLSVGKHGKSFGSVTARDIETSLKAKGFEIDRKQIRLPEPLKAAGEVSVDIKLHSELNAVVTVRVIGEKVAGGSEATNESNSAERTSSADKDNSTEESLS